MANISIYDPLSNRIQRLLTNIWHPSLLEEQEAALRLQPRIDVSEDNENYVVRADIPGVNKEDIRVDVEGNRVAISAELKRKDERKEKNFICTERYEGKMFRSFTLDNSIDDARATAKYVNGVLELTLPKKNDNSGGKRLTVQ